MTKLVQAPFAPPVAGGSPLPASRALRAFELHERIEAALAAPLTELREQLPRLLPRKAFFEGHFVLGLRSPPAAGPLDAGYSRVDLEVAVDGAAEQAAVICRRTTRGRDWPRQSLPHTTLDAAGFATLIGWCEERLLEFAQREFDATSAAPVRLS